QDVAWLEIDEAVRTGPDGSQVRGRLARFAALERLEDVAWQDHAGRAAERVGPVRCRALEDELHGIVVDALDPIDALIGSGARRRRRGIGGVLPREDHIVGRERPPVVPRDTALEAPL